MISAEVPGDAVMTVRQHLIDSGCTIPAAVIEEALVKAWPHLAVHWRECQAQRLDDMAAEDPKWFTDRFTLRAIADLLREEPL